MMLKFARLAAGSCGMGKQKGRQWRPKCEFDECKSAGWISSAVIALSSGGLGL